MKQKHVWTDYLDEVFLSGIYPDSYKKLGEGLYELMKPYLETEKEHKVTYSESDIVLISYGDSILKKGENPLKTLYDFSKKYLKECISAIHLLPVYPYSSDDGFSVIDYLKINPELGTWSDIEDIGIEFDLMLDAVINHISKESQWFKNYQQGIEPYNTFFFEKEDDFDVSSVIRPRALPLFHSYPTNRGEKELWTTFSEDQIDLNYGSIDVIIELARVLLTYGNIGAKYIRLDAIGFAWKTSGTTCMHLPQTHDIIKLFRTMFDLCFGDVKLITETNVPHIDNISYFGNGFDEAHMVYQFPLPPLTLFSFITENTDVLNDWLSGIRPPSSETTYFNFLASHDGIGMRPTEGVLTEVEKQLMVDVTLQNGGRIGYKNNLDGTKSVYELNINYMDALLTPNITEDEHIKKFIAAQALLISLQGIPGIYIHSLLGSGNWTEGVEDSGINRRINREKLHSEILEVELNQDGRRHKVLSQIQYLLSIRRNHPSFSPQAEQEVLRVSNELFTIKRQGEVTVLVIINITNKVVHTEAFIGYKGINLINNQAFNDVRKIEPFEVIWAQLD